MTSGSRARSRLQEPAAGPAEAVGGARDDGGPAMLAVTAAGHGGRVAAAMAAYPQARRPWLDLSTGINPEPWCGARATREDLGRLPDPAGLAELETAAARAFEVGDLARIVATAGAEGALRLLARILPIGDVEIVSPTYASHEAAWRSRSRRVDPIPYEHIRRSAAQLLVVVNPNNPDGRTLSREALTELVESRARHGLWTLVDESFVETAPELSVVALPCERLVVLRSFGKFYGLPGLRLGFAIAPPELAQALREAQGEWPIGAEAMVMGARAYGDAGWRARTRAKLRQRADDFDVLLAERGLGVVGGTSLFRLTSVADAGAAFDGLCRAGILTRPFAQRKDWLRFGVPRREDFARVDVALRQVMR